MTIEAIQRRALGKADYLIRCDERGCRATLDARDRTFAQSVNFLRARGWSIRKIYETWVHSCPYHLARRSQK